MDKYEITRRIEAFAPPETAEKWDCSGWLVETSKQEVHKVMLALTVTKDIVEQARKSNCDMIISHHPLFEVPINFKDLDIYCAHTNMDLAQGGTTDTLIKTLEKYGLPVNEIIKDVDFVRYVKTDINLENLLPIFAQITPNFRYVNNPNTNTYKKLAFCAGSGAEFIQEAYQNGADGFITGDLKFHKALDSQISIFDLGHFDTEIMILDVFKSLIGDEIPVLKAEEQSPFKTYKR